MRGSGMIDSPSECGGGALVVISVIGHHSWWSAPVPVRCSEVTCLPHSLLDSRASCKHPKASSLLWLLPPRVIDGEASGVSVSLVPAWVSWGAGSYQGSATAHLPGVCLLWVCSAVVFESSGFLSGPDCEGDSAWPSDASGG